MLAFVDRVLKLFKCFVLAVKYQVTVRDTVVNKLVLTRLAYIKLIPGL